MTKQLDLGDIQGNILQAYVRRDFPKARFVFLRVEDGDAGRAFVGAVTRKITTSVTWGQATPKPRVTVNVAFTFEGLKALGLPTVSLSGFPEEFVMGMKIRHAILGDDGPSAPENWDPIWQSDVHLCLSINGQTPADVEERYRWIEDVVAQSGGVVLLTGHRGDGGRDDLPYQDASTLYDQEDQPTAKEHFGYTDGISDPVFEGQPRVPEKVVGRGKPTRQGGWEPLATGEFLLGHPDEAKEYPAAPMPITLSRNGTYLVYRKLHENVASFDRLLERHAATFPGGKELLAAKFSGRWRDNGAPLVSAPDENSKAAWDRRYRDAAADPRERHRMLVDFTYHDDLDGGKCPISAHVRRTNARGSLEFGQTGAFHTPGALDNRARL